MSTGHGRSSAVFAFTANTIALLDPMSRLSPSVVVLLFLLAGAGAIAVVATQRLSDLEARVSAVERRQQAPERQLAFPAAMAYRRPVAHVTPPMRPDARGGIALSQADSERQRGEAINGMKRLIAAEKRNPAWANNVQLNVRDVVGALKAQGLPIQVPTVDCRSSSCLMTFQMDRGQTPEAWLDEFLTEVAPDLPNARFVQARSADGARTVVYLLGSSSPIATR